MGRRRKRRIWITRIQVICLFLAIFMAGVLFGVLVSRAESKEQVVTVMETGSYYNVPLSHDLQDYIMETCETENVPVSLVLAVIETESNFDADAVSDTRDYGLMQINDVTHEWMIEKYGVSEILDSYTNVWCGIKLLSNYLSEYDTEMSLMAYNLGLEGARKLWKQGIMSTKYSTAVLGKVSKYE